jgi:hypothetical protein
MNINLDKLNFNFTKKPLLVGGQALAYHKLKEPDSDFDFIIVGEDYQCLAEKHPDNLKNMEGGLGVCLDEFEFWKSIFLFDYSFWSEGAIEESNYLVISLEKLLLMSAFALTKKSKYLLDVQLVAKKILGPQRKRIK